MFSTGAIDCNPVLIAATVVYLYAMLVIKRLINNAELVAKILLTIAILIFVDRFAVGLLRYQSDRTNGGTRQASRLCAVH